MGKEVKNIKLRKIGDEKMGNKGENENEGKEKKGSSIS